jgi:hypothetical protein
VVAVQVPVNPDAKVTGGEAERVNVGKNVAEMVFPEARAPEAEVVKPTVQVESALGNVEPGENVTLVGVVGKIVTGLAGLAAAVSWVVATLKVLAR